MSTNNATNTSNPITVPQGGTGNSSLTAYSVMCGGTTTTGNVQSVSGLGSSGQVLTSNGAGALPTWQASSPSGAGTILLQTLTASSSSNLTFTSTYITNTYNSYMILFDNLAPSSSTVQLLMDWSTDNGSTYLNSNYTSGVNSTAYGSATWTNANSTTTSPLSTTTSSTGNRLSGNIIIVNLTSGSPYASYTGRMFNSAGTNMILFGANSGTTVNNIRFTFSSGNISSGKISLYGIAE